MRPYAGMRIVLVLVAVTGVAGAEPPSSYQCKPGTAKTGVGCACPAGYQDRRDGDNAAICYARTPPVVKKPPGKLPAKPAPAATGGKYTRVTMKVAATPLALVAKPLPALAPSFTGTNDSYKAAWASITAKSFQAGLEALKQLAASKDELVRRAVVVDLPRVYVEAGAAPEGALAMFRPLADAPAILDALGKLYLAKPNADGALAVYRDLSSTYTTHSNRCAWLEAAGRASAASSATSLADKTAAASAVVAEWLRSKPKAPACRDGAAALVGDVARWAHGQGSLDTAETLYQLYASTFADQPAAPEHAYYLAELLWTRAEQSKAPVAWENAALAFTDAARTGKLVPKLEKEALYASVLAWKNALASDPAVKSLVVSGTAPTAIPAREAKMIASLELYISMSKDPTDPEIAGIKFLEANIYRRSNRFDEAIPMFRDILEHHSGEEVAESAANLALDALNRLGRFTEMLVLVDELLAMPGFLVGKEDLHDTLIKIKRQGLAKRAAQLGAGGTPADAALCGKTFIEQYNADPLASDNDIVLANAMVCFEKGEAWDSWLKVFAVFEKYHSKSKLFGKFKALSATVKSRK